MKRTLKIVVSFLIIITCILSLSSCFSNSSDAAGAAITLIRAGYDTEIEREYEHGIHFVSVSAELGEEKVEVLYFENEKDARIFFDMDGDEDETLSGSTIYSGTEAAVNLVHAGSNGVGGLNTPEGAAEIFMNAEYTGISVEKKTDYTHVEVRTTIEDAQTGSIKTESAIIYYFGAEEDANDYFAANKNAWRTIVTETAAASIASPLQFHQSGRIIYFGTKDTLDKVR